MKPRLVIDLNRVAVNAGRFRHLVTAAFPGRLVRSFYAVKANSSPEILDLLHGMGMGGWVISAKDLAAVRARSLPIVAGGFVRSEAFLDAAVRDAEYVVIENAQEVARIEAAGSALGRRPRVLLSVRNGPTAKLGCTLEDIRRIARSEKLDIAGAHFHAHRRTATTESLPGMMGQLSEAMSILEASGRECRILNFGGGLVEPSVEPDELAWRLAHYREVVPAGVKEIHFEPGRYLVGDTGTLTCQIEYVDAAQRVLFLGIGVLAYKMTQATPSVFLDDDRGENTIGLWRLHGFWPSEYDSLDAVALKGIPRPGDILHLKNLGAYSAGVESRFDPEDSARPAFLYGTASSFSNPSSAEKGAQPVGPPLT